MTNFQIVKTIKSFTKETKYLLDDLYIFYTTHETKLEKHQFRRGFANLRSYHACFNNYFQLKIEINVYLKTVKHNTEFLIILILIILIVVIA